jgi:cell division protein FtsB
MREQGISLRKIAHEFGWNGVQSVKYYLNRYPNGQTEKMEKLRKDNKILFQENRKLKEALQKTRIVLKDF